MAKSKWVYIDTYSVGYTRNADVSPEIKNAEPIPTFDGPVPTGSDEVSWKVNIEKLRYGKIANYKTLERVLLSMLKTPRTIRLVEEKQATDGKLKIEVNVYKCTLTDKKFKIDIENETVENLSFTGTSMREWVNGEEIKY